MPDITQPPSVATVQPRLEGRAQGGGRDSPSPPAKKVVETYKEIDRTKPVDDRITILGIPAEQVTAATHAALASLVAEINFLRSMVNRLERGRNANAPATAQDVGDKSLDALAAALAAPAAAGEMRTLVLANLNTFEDVRRSSGLLAAKGLLADVFARFANATVVPFVSPSASDAKSKPHPVTLEPRPIIAASLVAGAAMAGVIAFEQGPIDETAIAEQVRDAIATEGFLVSGIEMSVSLTVGAVAASVGEGILTAIGRVDHLIRGSGA
ncbi:MAG: hypothetical protein FJX59_10325 [Alphaproteobacteria bacterium]|nr:hypothetical protein [Alphaproteobacteria bacterium]